MQRQATIAEALDFRDESEALYQLIKDTPEAVYDEPTQFKGWTLNDILQHLHFFNVMADLSLSDAEAFKRDYGVMADRRAKGETMLAVTDDLLNGLKGHALRDAWRDYFRPMGERWMDADPKQRVPWAGPEMSARSSISARLMETWAHGQEVYDHLGVERKNADRIRSIAHLGANTFGWTFANRGEQPPGPRPYLRLTAPSGAIWEWGEVDATNAIQGKAEEFCQVVAQTRNIADVSLDVIGPVAERWMAIAQCFAGAPNDPPAPGTRFRRTV